jgi:hypothetical protein
VCDGGEVRERGGVYDVLLSGSVSSVVQQAADQYERKIGPVRNWAPLLLFKHFRYWFVTVREQHRLRVFVNRVLRGIFETKRDEVTENGESCTVGSFIICTHHQILLGRSNQGE